MEKNKRIAIAIHFHTNPGGAERRFARLYNHICQKHIAQKIFLIINQSAINSLESSGIFLNKRNLIVIKDLDFGKLLGRIHFLIQLFKEASINNIDLIHYPVGPNYCSFIQSFLPRAAFPPYSLSIVNSQISLKKDLSLYERLIWRRSLQKSKKIDFLSPSIKNNILRLFQTLTDSEVSPCSFTDYTETLSNKIKKYDLVMMARWVEGKGYPLFFDALEVIKKRGLASSIGTIGVFGFGNLKDYIQQRVDQLKEYNFDIGYIKNAFEIHSTTKIFLSLQEKENYPSQSILEAAASGAVIIATNVGDTRLIVNKETGHRIEPKPNILADKIIATLSNYEAFDQSKSKIYVKNNHNIDKFSNYFISFISET